MYPDRYDTNNNNGSIGSVQEDFLNKTTPAMNIFALHGKNHPQLHSECKIIELYVNATLKNHATLTTLGRN